MELRQLEYFQMVSRLNNITRAAERLHVSQPSITKSIKKLERELNVQLFDRSQKNLVLTPEGSVFLSCIDRALSIIDDATLELNDYKKLQKGAIKIGIPPMIGSYLFPQIFSQFQQLYPQLEISILEEGSLAILDRLENGEMDLGIAIVNDTADTLNILPIATQQILVCLPPHHPLVGPQSLSLQDLQGQPLIMLKDDSYHRRVLMAEFAKQHVTPRVILSSSQIETIKGLVANGTGIAFFLDVLVRNDPTLIALPLNPPLSVDIGLVWKKKKYLSRASRAFIDFIVSHLDACLK